MNLRSVLNWEMFRLHGTPVTLASLLTAALVILAGLAISRVIQRGGHRAMAHRAAANAGNVQAVLRLTHYAIMLMAIATALQTVGIDLSTLFAAGAILAFGLGFAMQNIAQNFVSGVILLVERTVKPGDIVEVDGQVVRVEELALRATLVRTRFEEEMIVPNSLLVQSTIKNFTLHDSLYRVRTSIGVAYESDLRIVRSVLETAAASLSVREVDRAPLVLLTDFGSSSVDFEVSVWTRDPWSARRLQSQLNEAIWWALQDAGIGIPFPQRTVHVDADLLDALRR